MICHRIQRVPQQKQLKKGLQTPQLHDMIQRLQWALAPQKLLSSLIEPWLLISLVHFFLHSKKTSTRQALLISLAFQVTKAGGIKFTHTQKIVAADKLKNGKLFLVCSEIKEKYLFMRIKAKEHPSFYTGFAPWSLVAKPYEYSARSGIHVKEHQIHTERGRERGRERETERESRRMTLMPRTEEKTTVASSSLLLPFSYHALLIVSSTIKC